MKINDNSNLIRKKTLLQMGGSIADPISLNKGRLLYIQGDGWDDSNNCISSDYRTINTLYTNSIYSAPPGGNLDIAAVFGNVTFSSPVKFLPSATVSAYDDFWFMGNSLNSVGSINFYSTNNTEKQLNLSANWTSYTNVPLIADSVVNRASNEIRNNYAFTSQMFGTGKYSGLYSETNFSTVTANIFSLESFYGLYIKNTPAGINASKYTSGGLVPVDSGIYVENNGVGAGIISNNNTANTIAFLRPDISNCKGIFSQGVNSLSGSAVGYMGYGNNTNATTGNSVGVLGLAARSTANSYSIGLLGLGSFSTFPTLNDKNWAIYGGHGHGGLFNGNMYITSNTGTITNYHPSFLTSQSQNIPTKFASTNAGCLYVSNTAEIKSLLHCQNLITSPSISSNSLFATTLSGDGYGISNINPLSHSHNYLPISGGSVTGFTYFTQGLTSSLIGIADGSETSPSLYFASDNDNGFYKLASGFAVAVDKHKVLSFNPTSVSSSYDFYSQNIYGIDTYVNSLSAATIIYAGSIQNNTFYYKTASNVEFYCQDDYHYIFNGFGGALFQGSVSANNNLFVTNSIFSDWVQTNYIKSFADTLGISADSYVNLFAGKTSATYQNPSLSITSSYTVHNGEFNVNGNLSANSFYGSGSGLSGVTDVNALPLSGGTVTGLSTFTNGLSANSITSSVIRSSGNNSGIFLKSNGFIGVGSATDPTYIFHVASGGVVRNYIESTDGGQASTDLRSGSKHSRMITDSSFIWRLYDQTSGRAVNLFTINHTGIGRYLGPSFTITGSLSAQSISGNGSGIPHNSLSGLLNNDHPQYSLSAHTHAYLPIGGGILTGDLNLSNNNIFNINTLAATLSLSSTNTYTSNLHGANSDNLQIRAGNTNKIVSFDYGSGVEIKDQSLSANDGFQTNQILPIDVNGDSIAISTNQNLNLFSIKGMSISSNGNINIESAQTLSLTGLSEIDLYGDTRISGSLSATQPISGFINSNAGFVLENRTSDPVSPEIGRIWFRTDL